MKKFILGSGFVTIAILITIFVLTGCSKNEDDGKIAITTMSSEAKNDFVEGRNHFEKLQQRESLQYFENAFANDNRFAMAYYYHSLANPTTKGFFEENNLTTFKSNLLHGLLLSPSVGLVFFCPSSVIGHKKRCHPHSFATDALTFHTHLTPIATKK